MRSSVIMRIARNTIGKIYSTSGKSKSPAPLSIRFISSEPFNSRDIVKSSIIERIWNATAKYKIFTFAVLTYGAVMLLTEKNQRVQLDESAETLYLAERFQNEKNYQAAEDNYELCYQLRSKVYGKSHPLTRNSLLFVLQNLILMKSYDRVLALIEKSVMLKKGSMASPVDVLFLNYLGGFAADRMNRQMESKQSFDSFYSAFFQESPTHSLSDIQQQRAFDHVYSFITLIARHGRFKEAENLSFQFYSKFQHYTFQQRNQIDSGHQEMLLNLLELLSVLAIDQEQFIVAEQLLLEYVEMSRTVYADSHSKLSSILLQIADFYQAHLHNPEKARDYYLECYNRYKNIFGEDNPMIVQLLLSLGKCDFQILQLRIGKLLKSHFNDPEDTIIPEEYFPSQNSEEFEWLIQESQRELKIYYEKQLRLAGMFSEDTLLGQFELGKLYLWISKYRKHQRQEALANFYQNQAKHLLSSCYWTQFHLYGAGHPITLSTFQLLSTNFPNYVLSAPSSSSSSFSPSIKSLPQQSEKKE